MICARDGSTWTKTAPKSRRLLEHNILRVKKHGPTNVTKKCDTIKEVFQLLITDDMLHVILRETNRKAGKIIANFTSADEFTIEELRAFIGLCLYAGAIRSNRENIKDLWEITAHPIFRATMSRSRMMSIFRCIRFDNGVTREERLRENKAAAISDVFLMLNRNLSKCYVAGENVTVDEQLFPFRGRTKFTQYIPSKPARYGVKVWWLNDSMSGYPLKGQIYTGLAPNGQRDTNQGERVVKDLCCGLIGGSGRNVTCDNFFTSLDLAKSLMNDHNLSILGTVNKKRRFIPKEMMPNKDRPALSTEFLHSGNITMCSYVPKRNKAVVLLSTSHYHQDIKDDDKKKPLMILDYNHTKGGTDLMDHMLGEYTCHRKTNRWPLAFFYNILDVAALASFIIYKENKGGRLCRRKTLKELALKLCNKQILDRSRNKHVAKNFTTKSAIEAILGVPYEAEKVHDPDAAEAPKKSGRCVLCVKGKKTVSRTKCTMCNYFVCAKHYSKVCVCQNCNFVDDI